MSGDPLYVQPAGVRSYAQIHDEVVAGLSQLMGAAAPEAAGVQASHGTIASAVSGALSQVLGSRHWTLQATSTSAETMSELLQKAAQMYEHGDQNGAATLRAAAEELEGSQGATPGSAGDAGSPAGASGAGASGAGGGDMIGQLGQMGQQVGQMAQAAGAPLQALAQPLQQLPQQVMQGIQQASQSAGKAVDATGAGRGDPSGPQRDPRDPAGDEAQRRDESQQRDEARHRGEAAPGDSTNAGRAPEPPRVEHAQPVQTRPQSD